MDGVSTAFAAVSITLQLVGTVKEVSKFLKEVKDAPKEITRLADALSQLESLLVTAQGIVEQQNDIKGLPSSINVVSDALQRCESTIKKLETSIDTLKAYFKGQCRVRKTWASVKTVMRQEEVERVHGQVEAAMGNLQSAILLNMSGLQ